MKADQPALRQPAPIRRTLISAIVVAVLGALLIGATVGLSAEIYPTYLEPHRGRFVAAEVALFGILFVEMVVKALLQYYEQQDARQLGIMIRAVIRTIGYMFLAITILASLAQNPAFAAGIGGMVGIVVGFATQNIISNVFAGMFLAIGRPFKIDDEITVRGNTGRVIEFTVMHTVIDTEERIVLFPNSLMLTEVILRRKGTYPKGDG
jgi:small conductance mechanosensitive channel